MLRKSKDHTDKLGRNGEKERMEEEIMEVRESGIWNRQRSGERVRRKRRKEKYGDMSEVMIRIRIYLDYRFEIEFGD